MDQTEKGQPRGADPSESCTPPSSPIPRLLRAFCTSRHSPVCFPVSQGFLPSALPFVPSRLLPAHIFTLNFFFFLSQYPFRCHLWTFLRSDIYIFVFMPHSASCSAYRTSTCAKYSSALPSLFPSPPRSLEPSAMPVPDLFSCFLRWSTCHQPTLSFAILPLTPEQHLVLYRNTCKGRIN